MCEFPFQNLLPIKDICNLLKWSWKRFVGTKQFITIHLFYFMKKILLLFVLFSLGNIVRGNPIGVEKARQIAFRIYKK